MNTAKLLLSEKVITSSQYEQAYLDHQAEGGTIGFHLIRANIISSEALVAFQVERFGLKRRLRAAIGTIPDHVIGKITRHLANKHRVIPVSTSADTLVLGMAEPADDRAMDIISSHTGMDIRPVIISEEDMTWALDRYYNRKDYNGARETMPIGMSERITGNTADVPRETMSWGVTIEDALAKAVEQSVKQTNRSLVSIAPPAPVPEGAGAAAAKSLSSSLVPDMEVEQFDDLKLDDLEQSDATQGVDSTDSDRVNEMPTIIPEPLFAASEPPAPAHEAVLDSWADTRFSVPAHAPQPAETGARPFPSHVPASPVMAPRMSMLPPHKTYMRTEGELLHAIFNTDSRDDIIGLALEYMLRFSGRALFLIVKKEEIRGFHVAGEYTSREAIRSFWIPFSARSTLGQVAITGTTYLGPIGEKPADAVFCAALGGRPSHALVIPVILKQRTIGMLFADQVQTQEIAWPRLNRLTEAITASLSRFILKDKLQ